MGEGSEIGADAPAGHGIQRHDCRVLGLVTRAAGGETSHKLGGAEPSSFARPSWAFRDGLVARATDLYDWHSA